MTTHFMHLDPNIFTNPNKFDPHRWIREGERQRLEKYVVPFSKGSRACIGLQWVHSHHLYYSLSLNLHTWLLR